MSSEDFPITKMVEAFMSADNDIKRNLSADAIIATVRQLEQDAKASAVAAAKYQGRKAADAKRKKKKRRMSADKKVTPSLPSILDSEAEQKVRKRPSMEKTGDLFGHIEASDDWPADYAIQFWDTWPRNKRKYGQEKVGRKLASIRKTGRWSWAQVWDGLRAYLATNPDIDWVPAPIRWLNETRWQADYSVVLTRKKRTFGDIMRGGKAVNGSE